MKKYKINVPRIITSLSVITLLVANILATIQLNNLNQ